MSIVHVCQAGAKETKVEVRRVHMTTLKLWEKPVFEHFTFKNDTIKLITHQPPSNNLYAFGTWVRQLCVSVSHLNVFASNITVTLLL